MSSQYTDLTICSVSFRSARVLELNRELTTRLNPETDGWNWIVMENTPAGDEERLTFADSRFRVLPGVDSHEIPHTPRRGSYHHAAALNKALHSVETRFVLILDPDFFVVRPNWMRAVLDHMVTSNLAFFGAGYHAASFRKYRYFPCVFCMCIDRAAVDGQGLDFTPQAYEEHEQAEVVVGAGAPSEAQATNSGAKRSLKAGVKGLIRSQPLLHRPLRRAYRSVREFLARPRRIGSGRDTGCRVYSAYANRADLAWECAASVYRNADEMKGAFEKAFGRFMPDGWLYVPKMNGYYSTSGFREAGLYDVDRLGWEEYLWRGEPFGFHVRGLFQGTKMVRYETLAAIVAEFFPKDQTDRQLDPCGVSS